MQVLLAVCFLAFGAFCIYRKTHPLTGIIILLYTLSKLSMCLCSAIDQAASGAINGFKEAWSEIEFNVKVKV